jgi:soluble lytic murein transglycosylase-like protein
MATPYGQGRGKNRLTSSENSRKKQAAMFGTAFRAAGAAALVAVAASAARAEIYMYRDARGRMHFSNAPTVPGYRPYLPDSSLPRLGGSAWRLASRARRKAFEPIIREAARRHQVESALVTAVIQAESNFVPYARSPKGALGLMQLMPETARMHNVGQVFDPRQNVEGGVKHLRLLLDRYGGNVRLALAAYNAGIEAVERYGGVPPYQETVEYLQRVLAFRDQYLHEQ